MSSGPALALMIAIIEVVFYRILSPVFNTFDNLTLDEFFYPKGPRKSDISLKAIPRKRRSTTGVSTFYATL